MINKPTAIQGRDAEWRALTDFATSPAQGASLGLVYGRRRQGKTFLLEFLAEECQGLLHIASQQTAAQQLHAIGESYGRYIGAPGPVSLDSWQAAIEALLSLGERTSQPVPVVIDEFPYLLAEAPEIPSLLQIALSPRGRAARQSRTRLILCGSALTSMRQLLSGTAPLRGRAQLEMLVHPFTYREAAEFWGLGHDPELAFRVHALVGGTPAYLGMSGNRPPHTLRDFDRWVIEGPLSPYTAIYREGDVLLQEEQQIMDPAVYFSVLAAIARGATRRGEMAAVLGRPDTALHHPLAVLEQLRLVTRLEDALRQRRPTYHIAEPMLRFHQLVIGPHEAALATMAGDRVWRDVTEVVTARIYGPHLEEIARRWCLFHATPQTLGGPANRVLPSTMPCREHRGGHQLDAVVIQDQPYQPTRVIAIGEAKATAKLVDETQLHRLDHLRELIPAGLAPQPPRLLLFSRAGFSSGLRAAAVRRPDVVLVDLERLYHGD